MVIFDRFGLFSHNDAESIENHTRRALGRWSSNLGGTFSMKQMGTSRPVLKLRAGQAGPGGGIDKMRNVAHEGLARMRITSLSERSMAEMLKSNPVFTLGLV